MCHGRPRSDGTSHSSAHAGRTRRAAIESTVLFRAGHEVSKTRVVELSNECQKDGAWYYIEQKVTSISQAE
jgi:uncharacterized protein YchJ